MTKANAIAMTRLSYCLYQDGSIFHSKEHHDRAIALKKYFKKTSPHFNSPIIATTH
jgi:hypothetical protein